MAIRNIRRQATNPLAAPGTPNTAPIYVDSDDNILKMIPAGSGTTEVQIIDASTVQTLTNKTLTSPVLTTPTVTWPTNLAKGFIPLSLNTARIISANAIQNTTEAGIPDGNTAGPSIARVNGATDKMVRLVYAANEVNEITFEPFAYPLDLDDTAALTVNLFAAMGGAMDTPTISIAYFEGVGDTDAGGATAAVTGTTPARYSRTIAAVDVGAFPNAATVSLTPGAHANDAIHIYAAWIEYAKKTA